MSVCEDISDFQLRRIEFFCKKLLSEKGYIRKWELLKEASLTAESYEKLEVQIQSMISALTDNMNGAEFGKAFTVEDM